MRRTRLAAGAAVALAAVAAPASATPRVAERLARADAPVAQLEPAGRVAVPGGGTILRFRQRVAGLPVLDAEAVVAAPPTGAPSLVTDGTVAGIGAVARPTLGRRDAIEAALAAARVERLRAPARARLGIDPRTGSAAWEVSLPAAAPIADLVVRVDAADGSASSVADLLRSATASAALFDPNPVVAQGSYAGLRDARDRDSDLLSRLRVAVTLPRLDGGRGCLSGEHVDARVGKRARPVCRPGLDFSDVRRSNDRFEALMAYYHVDRTREYVEELGLSRGLRSRPQRVRANGIRDDNSYYSPLTGSMTLGTGGVDDGEDADVIVHEYGHALQDQAVKGFGRSVGAGSIGEGFGDYLAAAMSAQRTGADARFDACIFDWDGVSYSRSGCGRRADRGFGLARAKRRCGNEIHCLGELWSSALYELRGRLGDDAQGRSVGDRVVLESNLLLGKRSGFRDGARALLGADGLLYGGSHRDTIEAEMVDRGICRASGC